MLRRSKDGRSVGLDCEFTVTDGEHFKRKFWVLFTLEGATVKHAEAGDISRGKLRAILESAHGIRPDDLSEAAFEARRRRSADWLSRLEAVPDGGTRITYRTEIGGPTADQVGPELGPAITADFPHVLAALAALAADPAEN